LLKEIKEQNKIEKYLTIFENEKGNLLVALLAHAKLGSGSLAYEKLREYYGLIE